MKLKNIIDRYDNVYIIARDRHGELLEKRGPYKPDLSIATINSIVHMLSSKWFNEVGESEILVLRPGSHVNDELRKQYGIPYRGESCLDVLKNA